MRSTRVIAVCVLLVLAGCGGAEETERRPAPPVAATPTATATATPAPAAGGGAESEVRELVAAWQRALRAGDARTACTDLLARDVRRRIEELGGDCASTLLEERIAEAGPDYRMEITALTVRGDAGTVTVRETGRDGTSVRRQPVVREDGRWRLGV